MANQLVVLRGLPGAGKSSFAALLNAPICCADDFFYRKGEYIFDAAKLAQAHFSCFHQCENLLRQNTPLVVVANTTTTDNELQPYLDLAAKYGYLVHSLIVENRHASESIHNVPKPTIEAMKSKLKQSIHL